ncbi:MAG: 50S ribosomal protein L23 [Tissierellia bacterium]|nr:50S ribosomal protein L23 [Tissierellia bacterium]
MTAYDIILAPIVSENSLMLTSEKKYTFRVHPKANKYQIKDAVEEIFNVKVTAVNTMHVNGKPKRQGRHEGTTRNWKKAIVTLSPDSKEIEFFEGI